MNVKGRTGGKKKTAKLPLCAARPTCAALDIHWSEQTIGGAGLMRLSSRNLLDDYQA
jgi:hypothetical protein